MELPEIVDAAEWCRARDALTAKEKEQTRARDALAAERRRLPMTEFRTVLRPRPRPPAPGPGSAPPPRSPG